jgi:pimeloyl-ACP methyl ester carboxylesterase
MEQQEKTFEINGAKIYCQVTGRGPVFLLLHGFFMSSASYFPKQAREIMRATAYETADPGFLEFLNTLHPGGERQIKALYEQFCQFARNYDDMNFTPPDLSTICVRTLIVHGDRDEYYPISMPVEIYHAIPQAALWIVPNASHTDLMEAIGVGAAEGDKFPPLALAFLKGGD